jgi:hypothetical protein
MMTRVEEVVRRTMQSATVDRGHPENQLIVFTKDPAISEVKHSVWKQMEGILEVNIM